FMFITTVVVVVGIWLVLGLRSGLWAPGFLLTIFVLTFQFAIFYSVSTLFGVLTRSPIVSILMSCVTYAVLFVVGWGWAGLAATRQLNLPPPAVLQAIGPRTVDAAHYVLPRYKDLDILNSQLIGKELLGPESPDRKMLDLLASSVHWGESVAFTLGFIVLML